MTPERNNNQKIAHGTYRARPTTIKPKRPAPAIAARVSGATLPVADAEAAELAEVAVALLCEPELEPE